jgi:hypothetical protein
MIGTGFASARSGPLSIADSIVRRVAPGEEPVAGQNLGIAKSDHFIPCSNFRASPSNA